eukprot:CAMPEP_0174848338 /NCGR_PEP_ID=MMETSP1114-20130205/13469_1 /TAXON_ID=312471 /ORGANISM="Neobodo designis, Strain CCAP 1951/1" /LENGTH=41 /DNA_ID= /DNA_START= /DNA_END= /DNA_ORIENTATION=
MVARMVRGSYIATSPDCNEWRQSEEAASKKDVHAQHGVGLS